MIINVKGQGILREIEIKGFREREREREREEGVSENDRERET